MPNRLLALIGNLPKFFNRDPGAIPALTMSKTTGASFRIKDGYLTSTPASGTALRLKLRSYTIDKLAAAINAVSGYSATAATDAYTTSYTTANVAATTATNLTYRQRPALGLGPNLVINGGFQSGSYGWTNGGGTPSVIADASSPTGFAAVIPGGSTYQQFIRVEAGATYSVAVTSRNPGGFASGNINTFIEDSLQSTVLVDAGQQYTNATTYTDAKTEGIIVPARGYWLRLSLAASGGTAYITAVRVTQTATAPAWTAAHQVLTSRGAVIYEATTNKVVNGDAEVTPSAATPVSTFQERFTNLNAWTTVTGAPTVAANLVTMPAGASMRAGLVGGVGDMTDVAQLNVRFTWTTASQPLVGIRFVDFNNRVYVVANGGSLTLYDVVATAYTSVGSSAVTLTTGTSYWFEISLLGTALTAKIFNDNAGAKGITQIGATATGTITGSNIRGGIELENGGTASCTFGGTDPAVCSMTAPSVNSPATSQTYKTQDDSGVGFYALSTGKRFMGTRSFNIVSPPTGSFAGFWAPAETLAGPGLIAASPSTTYYGSARTFVSSPMTGGGFSSLRLIQYKSDGSLTAASFDTYIVTTPGTGDWQVIGGAFTTQSDCAYVSIRLHVTSVSQQVSVYFDNLGLEQKAYTTLNSGDGQEFTATTRAVANLTIPSGTFNFNDGGVIVAYRPDQAGIGTASRIPIEVSIDGNNRYGMEVDLNAAGVAVYGATGGTSFGTGNIGGTFVAGDTLAIGIRRTTAAGASLWAAKNGAVVTTSNVATTAAKASVAGTPLIEVGGYGAAYQVNGTIGIVRVIGPGVSDATMAALVANPYQPISSSDIAIWTFDGSPAGLQQTTVNTGIGAHTLLEGTFDGSGGISVTANRFTSPTYQLLAPIGSTLDDLDDDFSEGLRQTDLRYAAPPWLDRWGQLYGATRATNESDLFYARRINFSTIFAKCNGTALAQILTTALGLPTAAVTDTGTASFTVTFALSDTQPSYDSKSINQFITDYKTWGTLATLVFSTSGLETYPSTSVGDALTDSVNGLLLGQWGRAEFGQQPIG